MGRRPNSGELTEGVLIVVIFVLVFICFGLAKSFQFDELLASMSMGAVVVNFNRHSRKIFNMLDGNPLTRAWKGI